MALHWYALRTKARQERAVFRRLQAQESMEIFFPTLRVKPVNPRSAHIRPYFPGYMFVRLDLEKEGTNALRWSEGTYGLVRFGDVPAVVPDHLIHTLRERLARLGTIEALTLEGLQTGDEVEIVAGPLAGYSAIFDARLDGRERVQVLLSFLSTHPQRVQLDASDIRKSRRRRRGRK